MSEKHKKVCRSLNYFENFLVSVSAVSGCVSISALVGVFVGIANFAVGLKICVITAGIKKYKSIIKNKRKKNNKLVFLTKAKLNTIEVFISKVLIDSYINHDEFVSVNNVLREHNQTNERIKNPKNHVECTI